MTSIPKPIKVSTGEMYFLWGFTQAPDPYLVWGASLREIMNGACEGFICEGKDLRLFDATTWQFLGRGEFGIKTFEFKQPLDTFVIVYKDRMGFDALSGKTIDGIIVSYGYLVSGDITASYLDGSNINCKTIIDAENGRVPVVPPCGIIDPTVDGDKSYNLTNGPGGIVFNFLDRGFYDQPYATRKGYSLTNLTIVSAPISDISADMICP